MSAVPPELIPQLTTALRTRHYLPLSPAYLTHILSTLRQPLPPLPALTQTILFRILASDLTQSLSATTQNNSNHLLPPTISSITTKETRLTAHIPVQVLDITDIGTSKWSQVEAIERVERGEEIRGREVIRVIPLMNEDDDANNNNNNNNHDTAIHANPPTDTAPSTSAAATATTTPPPPKKSQGPHHLLLQDAAGTKAVAFERTPLPTCFIGEAGMSIGCKLILKPGTVVRRGMLMLTPENVVVLGGKIESWDQKWRDGRKGRLVQEVHGQQGRT